MIRIYTDGACLGNPGPGGYAAFIFEEDTPIQTLSGGFRETTNNRMELMAVIVAVESIDRPAIVVSDSLYVVNGISKGWVKKWQANGWMNAAKKPVSNVDLWQRLVAALDGKKVSFRWVRGHDGHAMNERCDELANEWSTREDLPCDEAYESRLATA